MMESMLSEKKDVIVEYFVEKRQGKLIENNQEVVVLFMSFYDERLPSVAKAFLKPEKYLQACMQKADEITKLANDKMRRSKLTILPSNNTYKP